MSTFTAYIFPDGVCTAKILTLYPIYYQDADKLRRRIDSVPALFYHSRSAHWLSLWDVFVWSWRDRTPHRQVRWPVTICIAKPLTSPVRTSSLVLSYCVVSAGSKFSRGPGWLCTECLISLAFFIYDILLTFDVEVEFFWKNPFTGAAALFLANRYLGLASVILNLIELQPFRSDMVSFVHSNNDKAMLTECDRGNALS